MVATIDIDFPSHWDRPPFLQHVGFVERGLAGRTIVRQRSFPGHLCFFRLDGQFDQHLVESWHCECWSIGSDIRSLWSTGGNFVIASAFHPAPSIIPTS